MKKLFSLAIVVFCAGFLRNATADTIPLTVNLSFQRADAGAVDADDASVPGVAWIFVLDHSGSMVESRDAVIEKDDGTPSETCTRWEALLRTFPLIVEQIEFGSVAYLVKVGNRSGPAEIFPRQEIRSSEDQAALIKTVRSWARPIKYDLTPLYGGLFLACQEAQRLIEKEGRNVCIVVFSDGNDFVGGKQFGQKRYTQADIDNFKALFAEDGFTACLNWINSTEKPADRPFGERYLWAEPKGGKVVIPIPCRVKPGMSSVSLKNPIAAGGKVNLRIPYSVSISPKRWNTVLADGFDADVRLRLPDGTDIGGDAIHVARDATSSEVCFRVPASYFAGGKGASFDLSLVFSEGVSACRFIQPPPVSLSFERQGAVTITAVKPGPDSDIVAKVGEAVSFSAEGTEGATFTWSFGDGTTAKGARVSHPFAAPNPKGVPFSVLAEKPGLIPAKAGGSVVVVEAGVKMGAVPSGLKVGQTAVFTCTGVGEVASYDWFVDGEPVVGEDAKGGASSRLSYPLAKVGEHKVRVRANMRRVSPEETPDVAFTVSPAPFATISKPEPNERFDAEASVLLEASVEGGFAAGVWTVKDASGAVVGQPIQSPVTDKKSTAHFNVPEAGGEFSVSFAAGEGEDAIVAAPVQFSAKAKDVRLDVVLPLPDAEVETGATVELKVASKGVSGNVVFVVSADGVETVVGRPAKVAADGSAGISHVFPVEDGQGDRDIFARSEDGKVISDPIPFRLKTNASIELKKPSNNAQVFYGGTLDFEAEVSGIADSKEVRWFLRPAGGGEQALKDAKGARYTHQFDSVPNLKRLSCEVYARVGLPDGSPPRETDHAIVRVSCPEIIATIEAPKDIALGEEFSVRLKLDPKSASVKSVTWDFGDGTTNTAAATDVVKHKYATEKAWTISATAICANCREEKLFSVQTSAQCPALNPVLTIDREDSDDKDDTPFGRGRPIKMSVSYETPGASTRATDIRWSFGDGSSETNLNPVVHSFVDFGEKTVSVTARCSSCGKMETATRTIRIDRKPPKAHFKICSSSSSEKPVGNWVSQGGAIALVDTSTGDISGLRWTCNGEPIPDSDDKQIVEFDCRDVGKQVFSLVAIDPAGVPSEPEIHSVRVCRAWLVALLLLLATAVTAYVWYYFAGDDPRFWKIFAVPDDDNSFTEATALDEMPASPTKLSTFWETGANRAKIPLHALVGVAAPEDWGRATANGQANLYITESTTARADDDKTDRAPSARVGEQPNDMKTVPFNNGRLVKIETQSPSRPGAMTALWIKIDTSKRNAHNGYLWLRIGLTLLAFGAAFALIAVFAA